MLFCGPVFQDVALADSRYRNDRWNYGESPAYSIRKTFRQPGGWVDFRADVRGETLNSARFFGDFFCTEDISRLEAALTDKKWQPESIMAALSEAGWEKYFPEFPLSDFIGMIFSASECA